MRDFTRRSFLASSALGAAALASPSAEAAAPIAGKQGPGVYRYKIGSYQLTALYDGTWFRKIDDKFVRNVSSAQVDKAPTDSFLPPGIVPTSFTPLLVNTGTKLILIDAGTAGQLAPTTGLMADSFAIAGIDPKAIDTILISHFHPDHINGIKDKDGKKVFPNAESSCPSQSGPIGWTIPRCARRPMPCGRCFQCAQNFCGHCQGRKTLRARQHGSVRNVDRRLRSQPGHTAFDQFRQRVDADAQRRYQSSVAVRAPSGMAGLIRHGRQPGSHNAPPPARPRGRRQDAGRRLSLPVPGRGSHRQGRIGLRSRSSDVAAAVSAAGFRAHILVSLMMSTACAKAALSPAEPEPCTHQELVGDAMLTSPSAVWIARWLPTRTSLPMAPAI